MPDLAYWKWRLKGLLISLRTRRRLWLAVGAPAVAVLAVAGVLTLRPHPSRPGAHGPSEVGAAPGVLISVTSRTDGQEPWQKMLTEPMPAASRLRSEVMDALDRCPPVPSPVPPGARPAYLVRVVVSDPGNPAAPERAMVEATARWHARWAGRYEEGAPATLQLLDPDRARRAVPPIQPTDLPYWEVRPLGADGRPGAITAQRRRGTGADIVERFDVLVSATDKEWRRRYRIRLTPTATVAVAPQGSPGDSQAVAAVRQAEELAQRLSADPWYGDEAYEWQAPPFAYPPNRAARGGPG